MQKSWKRLGTQPGTQTVVKMSSGGLSLLVLLISVGMHGVLLKLPLPQATPLPSPELLPAEQETGGAIGVTVLPTQPRSPAPASSTVEPSPSQVLSQPPPTPAPIAPIGASSPAPIDELTTVPAEPLKPEVMETGSSSSLPSPNVNELPDEPGTVSTTPTPLSLDQQLQDPVAYQYDGSGILPVGEQSTKLLTWTTPGQLLPSKADPLIVPYSLGDRCLDPSPVDGVLVVIVDKDQTLLRGPEVLSSTGYLLLDEKAKEMVISQGYTFPAEEKAVAYSLTIQVSYLETCPQS